MKIQNIKCTAYRQQEDTLILFVKASKETINKELVDKDCLSVFTDNLDKEELVEKLEGFKYLHSIELVGEQEYKIILSVREKTLEEVKTEKLKEIAAFDNSRNEFFIDEISTWLSKEVRSSLYAVTIPALEAADERETTLWGEKDGAPYPITVQIERLKNVLLSLDIFSKKTDDTTRSHKSEVLAMSTKEGVEAYDITVGYPDKLIFSTYV